MNTTEIARTSHQIKALPWEACESSALHAFAYDRASQTLYVEFNAKNPRDRYYAYHNVSAQRVYRLRNADSRGRYFALKVKPRYGCTRIDFESAVSVIA
jgi:hypothetical protein